MCLSLAAALLVLSPPARAQPPAGEPTWYASAEDGTVRVHLYVFWSAGCPHCHRALRFLGQLAEARPWLDVHALEVSVPDNAARYQAFAESLGVEARYVPAFFYCGEAFYGYGSDETTGRYLRERLGACHARLVSDAQTGTAAEAAPARPPIRVPLLGRLDQEAWSLPVVTVVLAGMDAFNPCAFFVLLFLLSLMVHARSRARMALVGGIFVLFSGLLYFLFMAAWLNLFLLLGVMPVVTAGAGLVALTVGAINLKDYVWFRRGISLSIPDSAKPRLYERTRELVGAASLPAMLLGTILLALAANAYELLCTAGFPLVFTRILTLRELATPMYYLYLALYNVVYVVPLLGIVVAFVATLGARKLKEEEGRILKLVSGLMMLELGAVLLFAPEWLSFAPTAIALIAVALVITAAAVWTDRHRLRRAASSILLP